MNCFSCGKPDVNVFCDAACREDYGRKQQVMQTPKPKKSLVMRVREPKTVLPVRTCLCGKIFQPKRAFQIYCERRCAVNLGGKRKRVEARAKKNCLNCGNPLGKGCWKFCSRTCQRRKYMQTILADPARHEVYKNWHRQAYYRRVGLTENLGW